MTILPSRIVRVAVVTALFVGFCVHVRAELPPAPAGSFTVVVFPDTQQYRGRGTKAQPDGTDETTNPIFDTWARWTADNLQRQRIVFVSHVGDIVDRNSAEQWEVARRCMDHLHGRIPYGICPGNHDMTGSGDSSLFQRYFPQTRFEAFPWYGGAFKAGTEEETVSDDNANSYQQFSAEGLDFVVLHLECNAPDDVLQWADKVLDEHAGRRAIVTTHMFLGPREHPKTARDYFDAPKGVMNWKKRHGDRGNTPQQMWDKCFRKHANLFLICCGDQSRTQAMRQTLTGEHGNQVYAVLSDYGVNGLRLYNFRPGANLIEVTTYNPVTGKLCTATSIVADSEQHQFELPYKMKP